MEIICTVLQCRQIANADRLNNELMVEIQVICWFVTTLCLQKQRPVSFLVIVVDKQNAELNGLRWTTRSQLQ